MSEQEKKRPKIYDLPHAETKPNVLVYKAKKKFIEKELFKEKDSDEDWTKDRKKVF